MSLVSRTLLNRVLPLRVCSAAPAVSVNPSHAIPVRNKHWGWQGYPRKQKPGRIAVTPTIQEAPVWTEKSKRTGTIAIKAGMTSVWDQHGAKVPVTVLRFQDCQVIQNSREFDGKFHTVQVGCINVSARTLGPKRAGHFKTAGVPPKKYLTAFPVTPDAFIPVGTELGAAHYVPGQFVDVTGTTIDKGYCGVMKRWGFKGGNASHGSSKHHRKAGSTGQSTTPGRIMKGKKMSGHMGDERKTLSMVQVIKVDRELNCIYVKGNVPGKPNTCAIRVRDCVSEAKQRFPVGCVPPFPTLTSEEAKELGIPREEQALSKRMDPFMIRSD